MANAEIYTHGPVTPKHAQELADLAYQRVMSHLLSQLRLRKWNYPESSDYVDKFLDLTQESGLTIESFGTTEKELDILRRRIAEPPYKKPKKAKKTKSVTTCKYACTCKDMRGDLYKCGPAAEVQAELDRWNEEPMSDKDKKTIEGRHNCTCLDVEKAHPGISCEPRKCLLGKWCSIKIDL
jgi:hypothetical protein